MLNILTTKKIKIERHNQKSINKFKWIYIYSLSRMYPATQKIETFLKEDTR